MEQVWLTRAIYIEPLASRVIKEKEAKTLEQ
jgi:hypothetical protein